MSVFSATIDAHTHAFPKEAVTDPEEWAARQDEPYWGELVASREGRPSLQGWVSEDEFLNGMKKDFVGKAVLLGWYWQQAESCRIHNEEMVRWLRAHPESFKALACAHPDGPPPSELVRWVVEKGFSGFGELFPAVQGSGLDRPFWNDLAEQSAEAGLLFNFHVSEPVGRPHPGRTPTPFDELERFVSRHPSLRIVLSHWGGGLFLHELNPFVRRNFQNVYYDCSASPLLYDPTIFSIACQILPPGKILFGSDYPLRLYPRLDREPGWARFVAEVRAQNLDPEREAFILSGNAQRLFGF